MADAKKPDAFTDLLTKLVRVPKQEIDEQEREYQQKRDGIPAATPGQIVPSPPPKT